MSITRSAVLALTLVGAGIGCNTDHNATRDNEALSTAPAGTTEASNTRGSTPMSTDTPSGTSHDMASPTGAGTTGTGNIAGAVATRSDAGITDQNREARRGVTKRSGAQRSDAGGPDAKSAAKDKSK